ncbi:FAD-dependent monooxygenase [Streptomyces sp. NPDC002122]|uniref:FAD-dependent monooxygenase n=1 Tax=Streptomyces sp. NPDC002122 TaxID=3154407 RepID=UPI00332A3897
MAEDQNGLASRASTDVVVLGAGPAGLVLGNLLVAAGIDCVVLERATRSHIRTRARAGFLAPNTVRILDRHGLADGLHRDGRSHGACEFRTPDGGFRLEYGDLGRGERHTVYPQQNLVTDLLERHVAGCDGRHGAARRSLPPDAVRHHHDHGVSRLGLLAQAPPSLDAVHDRGFAGHMARGPQVTRYYLECRRGTPADAWSEERIWDERGAARAHPHRSPVPARHAPRTPPRGRSRPPFARLDGVRRPLRLRSGDFVDVPHGGDVYALSRILHDWDDDRCREIVRHRARAMPAHADLLIVERLLPTDGSPSLATAWDLHMMCNVGGRERSAEHYARLLGDAGLELLDRTPRPRPRRATGNPCPLYGTMPETIPPGATVHLMQHTATLAMMRMMPPPPEALR